MSPTHPSGSVERMAAAAERTVQTWDAAVTAALGHRLAAHAAAGDVVCLWGGLGAGKTVLAKGFGAGLGITETITSPTFVLMAEYEGRLPMLHLDLYRLADATDAFDAGLLDDRRSSAVTLIEWPERLGVSMPADRLDVMIEGDGDDPRTISVRATAPGLERYLQALL